jgi:hypothetical protein
LISISAKLNCPPPFGLKTSNITKNSAQLNWGKGCSETKWDVHVAVANSGSSWTVPNNPGLLTSSLSLNNLLPNTKYEYRVRAVCVTGSSNSAWAGPYYFNTYVQNDEACDAIALTINGAAICGDNTNASVQSNEALYYCSTPNNTVWYKFTPSLSGDYAVEMSNSTAPYLYANVTLFTASACPAPLTYTPKVFCTYIGSNGTVALNNLSAGQEYYLYIDGSNSSYGSYCIKVKSVPSLRLNAKVFLNHVNPSTLLMNNDLMVQQLVPITEPYVGLPLNQYFIHKNNSNAAIANGFAFDSTGNNAIVDWVFLELRTGISGTTIVEYTKSALLQRDGDIVGEDGASPVSFPNVPQANYYVTVRHRNHYGFRTNATYALSSTPLTLDFTNGSVALFGIDPLNALSTTLFTMNGGDANADGSLDSGDSAIWETQNGAFNDYYLNADFNLDGSIDGVDSAVWQMNNGKYEELD